MRDLGIRPPRRIVGRHALTRRLRGLLVAVHRYGRGRARTAEDVSWTARTLDALQHALDAADAHSEPEGRP